MPAAVLILIVLFAAQRFGTERIGRAFGPIMLLWFIVIALLGAYRDPAPSGRACRARSEARGAVSWCIPAAGGFLVLGGVFLCITGGEALYADMGHFGKGRSAGRGIASCCRRCY